MFFHFHTLMMTRRTLLGAEKCAFRDLRRELATIELLPIVAVIRDCRVSGEKPSCRDAQNWSSVLGASLASVWGETILPMRKRLAGCSEAPDRIRRNACNSDLDDPSHPAAKLHAARVASTELAYQPRIITFITTTPPHERALAPKYTGHPPCPTIHCWFAISMRPVRISSIVAAGGLHVFKTSAGCRPTTITHTTTLTNKALPSSIQHTKLRPPPTMLRNHRANTNNHLRRKATTICHTKDPLTAGMEERRKTAHGMVATMAATGKPRGALRRFCAT